MMSKMMGGGEERLIEVTVKKAEKIEVKARLGLYGTGIGVVIEEPYIGYIVMPRWQDVGKFVTSSQEIARFKWTPDKISHILYDSLYSGLRQAYHILHENYGETILYGERQLMIKAIKAGQELNFAALGLRKGNVAEYEKRFNEIVDEIEAQIGKAFYNLYKQEGLKYLERLRQPRDKKGRPSETVKMVEAKAAETRFKKRLDEVSYIMPVITERRKALEILRDMIELRFQETKGFLADLLGEYHFTRFTHEPIFCQRVVSRLGLLANEIATVDVQPYTFTAMMIAEEFKQTSSFLKSGDFNEAKKILDVSWRSIQFKDIQRELEEIIMQITVYLFEGKIELSPSLISAKIKELLGKLEKISEEGFKIRTKARIVNWLEVGSSVITSGTKEAWKYTRDCLKRASDYMQEMGNKK